MTENKQPTSVIILVAVVAMFVFLALVFMWGQAQQDRRHQEEEQRRAEARTYCREHPSDPGCHVLDGLGSSVCDRLQEAMAANFCECNR